MNPREHAAFRLVHLAGSAAGLRKHERLAVDITTSLADARIALGVARGIPLDYIDPASGVDFSPRAYRTARASWMWHLRYWPEHTVLVGRALDGWLEKRPDVVAAVEAVLAQ